MATPPRRPSLPVTPQSFRRSFTAPVRASQSPQPEHVDPSDAAANILYSHPSSKTFSFSPPNASQSKPSSLDVDYPIDAIETLPWSAPREHLEAQGPLIIEKVRGSTAFLKTGKVLHAMMRGSQCWCVDGDSKFVLRVRQFQYYRIEFPNTTDEDKQKIEELKAVLRKILKFEVTPCPFKRDFKVELPETSSTPKKKKAWQPRKSLSKSSPIGMTSSTVYEDDRPESRASNFSDAITEVEQVEGSDSSQSRRGSISNSIQGDVPEESEGKVDNRIQSEDGRTDGQTEEDTKIGSPDLCEGPSSDEEPHQEIHNVPQIQTDEKPPIADFTQKPDGEETVDEQHAEKTEQDDKLELDTRDVLESNKPGLDVIEGSLSSPSRVDPADFGLESPGGLSQFESTSPITFKQQPKLIDDTDRDSLKEDNVSISGDSFHSLATHLSSSSSLVPSPPYWDAILPIHSHKRGVSEATVTAETLASNGSDDSERPSTPKLVHDSPSDAEWPDVETPAASESVRRFIKEKRARLGPVRPASSSLLRSSNRPQPDRNLGVAVVQKAASFAVGKPLEVMILLIHVLGRIAGGATVNDLMSGELFRRPDLHRGGGSSTSTSTVKDDQDGSDKDDYNYPLRSRSRTPMRDDMDWELD